MKNNIDDLEKEVSENKKKKKEEHSKEPNPYEEFCKQHGLEPIRHDLLTKATANNLERLRATNLFGRKPKINFHQELLSLRQHRKQIR